MSGFDDANQVEDAVHFSTETAHLNFMDAGVRRFCYTVLEIACFSEKPWVESLNAAAALVENAVSEPNQRHTEIRAVGLRRLSEALASEDFSNPADKALVDVFVTARFALSVNERGLMFTNLAQLLSEPRLASLVFSRLIEATEKK